MLIRHLSRVTARIPVLRSFGEVVHRLCLFTSTALDLGLLARISGMVLFLLTATSVTKPATFVVNRVDDGNDGVCDSHCTLREAVGAANAAPTDDVITFSTPQSYPIETTPLVVLNNGSLLIVGHGQLLTRFGAGSTRMFRNEGVLRFNDVWIQGGTGVDTVNSGFGGAVYNAPGATLTFFNTILRMNNAVQGGAVYNNGGSVAFINSTIDVNRAMSDGGAVYSSGGQVSFEATLLDKNKSLGGSGGGIFIAGGTLGMIASTVQSNSAVNNGGGISNSGMLTLTRSTIAGNAATQSGGGVYTTNLTTSVSFLNSTVSGNTAFQAGGGIAVENGSSVSLQHATIAGNSSDVERALGGSGGGIYNGSGTVNSTNSIIGENTDHTGLGPDFHGTLSSQGHNLIENVAGTTLVGTTAGNILGQSARLAVLGSYGGVTRTRALMPGSPAIDAADPVNFSSIDQRSLTRPQDGDLNGTALPDIGAYERVVWKHTVTKTADTNDGTCDADCSLREAIGVATGVPYREGVIEFSPAVFSSPQTITLASGELILTNGIFTIVGPGPNLLSISGNDLSRVFQITSTGAAVMRGLKVTRGRVSGAGGGGIYNNGGALNIDDVHVTSNSANFGSGINSNGSLSVSNSLINLNVGPSGLPEGGGIRNMGELSVSNTTFDGNGAFGGSALLTGGPTSIVGSTFTNSTISAAIQVTFDVTRIYSSAIGTDAGPNPAQGIQNGGTLLLHNSTVINNGSGLDNGGTMDVKNTLIRSNRGPGIGITGGTMTVTECTLTGNLRGGVTSNGGTLNISHSAIVGNINPTINGSVYASGGTVLNMTNTTVSENMGGGVEVSGIANLTNVTVSNNSGGPGGVRMSGFGAVNLRNTIVADNTTTANNQDIDGIINSLGYNVIENPGSALITGTGVGNVIGKEARLTRVQYNNGPTPVVGLQATSPAIDAGDPSLANPTDQRGWPRPLDGNFDGVARIDIGAYERQPSPIVVTKTADTNDGVCDSDCSLREAVGVMNASLSADPEVVFDPAVFAGTHSIILSLGELVAARASGSLAITGRGTSALSINANGQSRVIANSEGTNLTINKITIRGGNGTGALNSGSGGAVVNNGGLLTIANADVRNSTAAFGGGVANVLGYLRVVDSTVAANTSTNAGGGIFNEAARVTDVFGALVTGNSAPAGGGIHNKGTLVILDTAELSANHAGSGDGAGLNNALGASVKIGYSSFTNNVADSSSGGGIYNAGTLTLTGSTLSGNQANANGGAIVNISTMTCTNLTISGNSATNGGGVDNQLGTATFIYATIAFNNSSTGGGVRNVNPATFSGRNLLVANNQASSGISPDFNGNLQSNSFNLVQNPNGLGILGSTTGNIFNVDPLLDPELRKNGGPTKNHALTPNSPAIDKGGSGSNLVIPVVDQRRFARPVDFPSIPNASSGNGADIGSYERRLVETIPGSAPFDFDGDGKTDVAIFRPSVAEWWINRSSNSSTVAAQFGSSSDVIVPGDFTGDGKSDIAVWRPSSGEWFVLRSEDSSYFSFPFGTTGDVPAPADYDADGKTDPTVFRPSNSTWYVSRSGDSGTTIQQFGAAGDLPVPADYDGDGKADIAIFRPSVGQWWINRSTAGVMVLTFGNSSDKVVQGDYTGDGKSDVALWRPSTGEWFILRSEDFSYFTLPFGTTGDVPAPGDYDGDGKFDTTVFRPSSATWFSQRTTAGILIQQFGLNGDRPVPNAFVP